MNLINEAIDSIQETLKDCLLIIDLGKLDPENIALIFDKLNKIIIASTLLSRHMAHEPVVSLAKDDVVEFKLHLLNILKLISSSIKSDNITRTHDLIRLDLRDTLIRWIIQVLPPIRISLTELPFGQAQNSVPS